jgi:hypothetical protein
LERVHRTWLRIRYGIEGRVRRKSNELFEDGGGVAKDEAKGRTRKKDNKIKK